MKIELNQLRHLIGLWIKNQKRLCYMPFLVFNMLNAQDNVAPVVTAMGEQVYCPGTEIPVVTAFNIIDIDDTEIDQFSIQISEGYERGTDVLRLIGVNLGVTTTWDAIEGKLTFRGTVGGAMLYTDLIPAVQNVVFESTSDSPAEEKSFSLTVGSANYLPETDHYYEYVPSIGIQWDVARIAAENRTFFGLQGYLVTITSQAEAQLSGEQAAGTGWIGGSDEQQEGVWRWMTGPEAGDVFWNGGINGTTPNFAFWNNQEPNNVGGGPGEDYAHITAPGIGIAGSWNDLRISGEPIGDYQPKGYIVEYGGTPGDPVLNLSASTTLTTPKIRNVDGDELCGEGIAALSAETNLGEVIWFQTETGGVPFATGTSFQTPMLNSNTVFYVLASVGGCLQGERRPVEVMVKTPPNVNTNIVLTNCDQDGLADGFTDFNLNEYLNLITDDFAEFSFSFFESENDAENGVNILPSAIVNNMQSDEVFFRAEGSGDFCYSTGRLILEVSTTSFPDDFLFELQACDFGQADGITEFNLEEAELALQSQFPTGQNLTVSFFTSNTDAILQENEILNTSSYFNISPFSQTLFVRVDDNESGTCFGIGEHLMLSVFPLPLFELENEYEFCTDFSVQITPINPSADYEYLWLNSSDEIIGNGTDINIAIEGNYSVIATSQNNCSSEELSFTVIESGPPQFSPELILVDSYEETITVFNANGELGLGNYEFTLDNPLGPFQLEATFTNVQPGLHTIYAVDINGCGSDTFEVGVVGVPNFFTPNNDSVNDEIRVLGITDNFYQSGNLFVYDRYGKLLAQENAIEGSWDGTYNGQVLPPSDYWYVLELIARDGSLEQRNGHFTLKQ